jgi:uncharacterized membrane protein YkvA (DUF1232 family)
MAKKHDLIDAQNTGFFQDLLRRVKLIYYLMGDKRVNFFLKILPVASLIYLFSPIDLAPGLALPVIGALDDAAVLWLGTTLFVTLCPEEIVQEHMGRLNKVVDASWKDAEGKEMDIVEVKPRQENQDK